MLEECWTKVYIVCTCHPTCFIQHGCPFILSFDVKSKMTTDMLLPVILSELVDSDDEKPRRGKTQEWIKRRHRLGSLQNMIKELTVEDRYAFKEMFRMSVEDFETALKHIDDLSLHKKKNEVIVCIILRFSFVESFEIRSSNIRNDVIRMKCWMNRSNVKIVLHEPENVR